MYIFCKYFTSRDAKRPINASFYSLTGTLYSAVYTFVFLHWLFRWFFWRTCFGYYLAFGLWVFVHFRQIFLPLFDPFWGVHKSTVNRHYISSFVRSSSVLCEQSTTHYFNTSMVCGYMYLHALRFFQPTKPGAILQNRQRLGELRSYVWIKHCPLFICGVNKV